MFLQKTKFSNNQKSGINKKHIPKFVKYGNPIFDKLGEENEKLLKNKDQRQHVPIHQQTATDEKGRRRFHGAFTGGFSAGYFNTVGSEEGWKPKTFVSSRSNRSSINQNIMDIMDEEDKDVILGEKTLVTRGALQSSTNDEEKNQNSFISIKSHQVNFGDRLLKVMGWKRGQGIGSVKKSKKKIYGPVLPNSSGNVNEKVVEIVPVDINIIVFNVKTDNYGIGYDPHHNAPEFKEMKKKEQTKQGGFGVGVFEDEDVSVYNDVVEEYDIDFSNKNEGTKNDIDKMEIDKNVQKKKELNEFVNEKMVQKTDWLYSKYPPPNIPKDENLRVSEVKNETPIVQSHKKISKHNPDTRGEVLGEKKLPEFSKNFFVNSQTKDLQKAYLELLSSRFVKAEKKDQKINGSGLQDMSTMQIDDEDNKDVEMKERKNIDLRVERKDITFEMLEWHPSGLLCKRFNCTNPYQNSTVVGTMNQKKQLMSFLGPMFMSNSQQEQEKELTNLIEDSDDEEDELSKKVKPDMSLFKSIFGDDDDDDVEMEDNIVQLNILKEKEDVDNDVKMIEKVKTKKDFSLDFSLNNNQESETKKEQIFDDDLDTIMKDEGFPFNNIGNKNKKILGPTMPSIFNTGNNTNNKQFVQKQPQIAKKKKKKKKRKRKRKRKKKKKSIYDDDDDERKNKRIKR